MIIYTSYFGRLKQLHKEGILSIGIALSPPRYFVGSSLGYLAPRPYMLRMTENEYTVRYNAEILAQISPKWFVEELERIGKGRDIALLCYEKPDDFCHRQLVAKWLKKCVGIDVREWNYSEPKKGPEIVQKTLFEL